MTPITIREARQNDPAGIASIYNQGIEDRAATFETELRSSDDIREKLAEDRFPMLVAVDNEDILGWAGLSAYRPRDCLSNLSVQRCKPCAVSSVRLPRGRRV